MLEIPSLVFNSPSTIVLKIALLCWLYKEIQELTEGKNRLVNNWINHGIMQRHRRIDRDNMSAEVTQIYGTIRDRIALSYVTGIDADLNLLYAIVDAEEKYRGKINFGNLRDIILFLDTDENNHLLIKKVTWRDYMYSFFLLTLIASLVIFSYQDLSNVDRLSLFSYHSFITFFNLSIRVLLIKRFCYFFSIPFFVRKAHQIIA